MRFLPNDSIIPLVSPKCMANDATQMRVTYLCLATSMLSVHVLKPVLELLVECIHVQTDPL